MSVNRFIKQVLWVGVFFACLSCNTDTDSRKREVRKEFRIAVVLPLSDGMEQPWRNAVGWALENLNRALIENQQICITAEWFDEDSEVLPELFSRLADRKDICAIVGPLFSEHAFIAAEQCARTNKVLIPALTSSERLMRAYVESGFLWCLTENDISQSEILLARAIQKGAKSVSLLARADAYGQTFLDWFPFHAKELGLTVKAVEEYTETNLAEKMEIALAGDADCLICVPSTNKDTHEMIRKRNLHRGGKSFLLFSDVAFLGSLDSDFEGMEGIAQTHDPESGFNIAYEVKYGTPPEYGTAHFYDATMLAGLAILDAYLTGESDFNVALRRVVSGTDGKNSWTEEGIWRTVEKISAGVYPQQTGASGKLKFDSCVFTNVLHSVYCHWQVYDGKRLILEYNTSDGSKRTNPSMANWNWKVSNEQRFEQWSPFSYPKLRNLHALIISASSGWSNYRHQADAYFLYGLLKRNGLSDDDIVLIAEDDIARNPSNPEQGCVRTSVAGENVYTGIKIDYKPSGLTPGDLASILAGAKRADLPQVITSDSTDNLLVYWVGHGHPLGVAWMETLLPNTTVANLFSQAAKEHRFRKVFFAMETCYSGKVGEVCADEAIPGLLCLMAANGNETSKACNFSVDLKVWMSNSFSEALFEQFLLKEDVKLYDLYHSIYNRVIGSHVSIYNATNFDNLYLFSIGEFLAK